MNDREYMFAASALDSRDVQYTVKISPTFGHVVHVPTPNGSIEITRSTTIGELYAIISMVQPKPW